LRYSCKKGLFSITLQREDLKVNVSLLYSASSRVVFGKYYAEPPELLSDVSHLSFNSLKQGTIPILMAEAMTKQSGSITLNLFRALQLL